MGQNRFLVVGLTFLILISVLISFPVLRHYVSDLLHQFILQDASVDEPKLSQRENDKKVCGLCHSDKSRDFIKKYQHAPFAKWYCSDCHVPHNVGTGKHKYVVDLDQLCFTCHFNRLDKSTYPYQHKPYQMGRCVDCHDPHASDHQHLLRSSPQTLCTACHKMDLVYNFKYKHKPYEIGACSDCHVPHASKYKGMTKLPGKQLCYTCHYDRKNELKLPVQHKPYNTGECTNCHGAHATPSPKLLLIPGNGLCLACHVGLGERLKTGFVHAPVKQKCTNCHLPHASAKPALLPASRTDLCYMCHFRIKEEFKKPSRHPVGNGLLHCDGCHDPHVAPQKKLLRKPGNELCYICHLGLKSTYEKLKHATKARGRGGLGACTNCHVPHGSYWKPLIWDKQEPLCNSCHSDIGLARYSHPVGEKYTDAWHGGKMHCSSCHGPHGTNVRKFLLISKDGLCLKCHGSKIKNSNNYDVHRLIPPRNEKKDSGIKTKVPDYQKEPISKTINKQVRTFKRVQ